MKAFPGYAAGKKHHNLKFFHHAILWHTSVCSRMTNEATHGYQLDLLDMS